jgi:hypothetical protein
MAAATAALAPLPPADEVVVTREEVISAASTAELYMGMLAASGFPDARLRLDLVDELSLNAITSLCASAKSTDVACSESCLLWANADPRVRVGRRRLCVRRLVYRLFHDDSWIADDDADSVFATPRGKLTQLCPGGRVCLNPEHMAVIPRERRTTLKNAKNIFQRTQARPTVVAPVEQSSPPEEEPPAAKRQALSDLRLDVWGRYYAAIDALQEPVTAQQQSTPDDLVVLLESRPFVSHSTRGVAVDGHHASPADARADARAVADARARSAYAGVIGADDARWVVAIHNRRDDDSASSSDDDE